MRSRIALLIGALFQGGCAALLNSDRPAYRGPIQQPVWHNATIQVEQTPVILNGAVFAIARAFGTSDVPRVYAFELATGRELWNSNLAAKRVVAAAGTVVLVADTRERGHVLDARSGAELGIRDAPAITAAADRDIVYVVSSSSIEAMNSADGNPRWHAPIALEQPMSPAMAGGSVYAGGKGPGSASVYSFHAESGALNWKWEMPDKTGALFPVSLAADESGVYVWMRQVGRDSFSAGLLVAIDASSGKEKWRQAASTYPASAGPVLPAWRPLLLPPNLVLIPDSPPGADATASRSGYVLRALDRATGSKVWQSQTNWKYETIGFFEDSLLVSDRQVHQVINENNETSPDSWVSAADLRTGKELWRSPAMELAVLTAPAAADGIMVVGSKPYTHGTSIRGKNEVAGLWAWRVKAR
jgi:outer membrane protein assembly factor BamB